VKRLLVYAWASPVSVAALPIVPFVLASGGRVRLVDGVLEVGGGALGPLLRRAIPGFPIGAITLGHVVLGADAQCLDESRGHERVHVAQYERWGLLFPILYVGSSVLALLSGGGAYADNAFEREASRVA
jgi:hypothetical protein